jgi:hypothetical protein
MGRRHRKGGNADPGGDHGDDGRDYEGDDLRVTNDVDRGIVREQRPKMP